MSKSHSSIVNELDSFIRRAILIHSVMSAFSFSTLMMSYISGYLCNFHTMKAKKQQVETYTRKKNCGMIKNSKTCMNRNGGKCLKFSKKETTQAPQQSLISQNPTTIQIFNCVFHFFITICLCFIPFIMYFILTGSAGREGSILQRIMGICVSILPIFCTVQVVLFCSKKIKLTQEYLHLNTLKCLYAVLFFILFVNSYICFFPANPITALYRTLSGTQDYYTQEKENQKNRNLFHNETPFLSTENQWGTEISLYYLEEKLYVKRVDDGGKQRFLEITPYKDAYFKVAEEGIYVHDNKSSQNEPLLDLMFLQKDGLIDGRDVGYYTNYEKSSFGNPHPSHMFLQMEGDDRYYNLDEFGFFLPTEEVPYGSSGGSYEVRHDIFDFLAESLPKELWDSQEIIYGHLPFYQLKPSERFSFPWLSFEPVDSRVKPEVGSSVAVNLSNKEGTTLLSFRKHIKEGSTQSLSLYADLDMNFSDETVEEVFLYLSVNELEPTVCSDVFSISREQYERDDW